MKTKKPTNLNPVPKIVFTPFKQSKNITVVVNYFNIILIIISIFKHNFTASDLSNLAQLTLNLTFVIGAIGLTIFSLKLDNNSCIQSNKTKKELIYSYLGFIFLASSISITSYILSLIDFGPVINKTYSILVLLLLLKLITSTIATIIAYFNIKY